MGRTGYKRTNPECDTTHSGLKFLCLLIIAPAVGLVASVAAVIIALICVGLGLSDCLGHGGGASLCLFVHDLLLLLGSLGFGLLSLLAVVILLGLSASTMTAGAVMLIIAALLFLLGLVFLFGLSLSRLIIVIMLVLIVLLMLLLGLSSLLGSFGLFGGGLGILRLFASVAAATAMAALAALMLGVFLLLGLIVDKRGSGVDMAEIEAGADALGNLLGNFLGRLGFFIHAAYGEAKLTGGICLQLGDALLRQLYLNGAAQEIYLFYSTLTVGSVHLSLHLGNGFEQMLIGLLLIL